MAVSDSEISDALVAYLEIYPDESEQLSEPMRLMRQGRNFASRRSFPLHVTAGALLVRDRAEVLLVRHKAYGEILLQPGGHLEQIDATLIDAAVRELAEETGVDPGEVFLVSQTPSYVEFGRVPARPAKNEPAHYHLDFGYSFSTQADFGDIQESEVTGAAWFPLAEAERLVGPRIARAVDARARIA